MNENTKLMNEIREYLHNREVNKLINLIPNLSYEECSYYMKKYYDNLKAMRNRLANCELIDKEEKKENDLLLELYFKTINNPNKVK